MAVVEGQLFGEYRIERRLGTGGMGTVYLAQHPRLPRKDAVKILADAHAEDPEFRARFLREAEIAAHLQHPNLVAIRDRGETDGQLWIAMQYVEGTDVAQLIARGPEVLGASGAVRVVADAAQGLDELHRARLLHRDVKPANLLVAEQNGQGQRVLVTDFGIARPADDSPTLAGSGGFTASLAYAAPEQIAGEPMDHRADVYALGCTLYHMLTGSAPFPRDNPGAVMYAHLNDPPPRPTQENPAVPAGFDAVIARAMAKSPAGRYPSCGALATAAQDALTGAEVPEIGAVDLAGAITRPPRRGRPPNSWLGGAAAAVVVVVAVAISMLVWGGSSASTTASTAATNSTSVNAAEWGAYAYVVEAFPTLLPPSPSATGYQEVGGCIPQRDNQTVSFDVPVPKTDLFCVGNRDPVRIMEVICNADRSPIVPGRYMARPEGDERWTRTSGAGHVNWGTDVDLAGQIRGNLEVYFDDPGRNFCVVQVIGGNSGADLRSKWWLDAPL